MGYTADVFGLTVGSTKYCGPWPSHLERRSSTRSGHTVVEIPRRKADLC